MADVSDSALNAAVEKILRGADLREMTLRTCMAALAKHYRVAAEDLQPRKKFVRKCIENFLENMSEEDEGDDAEDEDEKEEDEDEDEEDSGDDDENDDDDRRGSGAKAKPKPKKRRRPSAADEEDGWKPVSVSGLTKAVVLSEPLAELLGAPVMGRAAVQKKIIEYVKENNLQDEKDKRSIVADEALKGVFRVPKFTFFGLSKLISEHLGKVDDCGDEALMEAAKKCDQETLERLKAERAEKIANGEKPPASKRKKAPVKKKKVSKRSRR